ncbi:MAG: ABC transporter permease, partial [Nanoarchaeota archaeon]
KLTIQNAGTGFGPPGSTAVRKLTQYDIDLIKKVNGVDMVVSRLIRIVKVEYNKAVSFSYIGSMPNNQKEVDLIYSSFNAKVSDGRLLKADDRKKIVLGSDFAEENNDFGKQIRIGTNLKIQEQNFEVIGILEKSSSFQLNFVILMNEEDLKDLLNIGDETDLIVAQVKDINKIEQVAEDIKEKLRKDRKEKIGEEDFSVQTPIQAIESVNTILNIINVVVVGIAAISLFVGGIGIANTMYTSVLERTREIGTMKAVGARNSDILLIFIIESGFLGLAGGIIGAGIGLGLAYLVSSVSTSFFGSEIIKFQISWLLLIGAISFSFFVGIFSGIFPAIQASKLKPVDALRS